MQIGLGIALTFIVMLCWSFTDFFIQRSSRKMGSWETLFLVSLVSTIALIPFALKTYSSLMLLDIKGILIMLVANVLILVAALIDFEALKRGKLAIVESIWSFEIPAAAFLAFFLIHERISVLQWAAILILMVFLFLVSFRGRRISKLLFLERGVIMAFIGAIMMGSAQFFIGWGSRILDPILVNFVTDVFMMVATGFYLVYKGFLKKTFLDMKGNFRFVITMSLLDVVAWVAYSFSMTLAPIAIATALAESYIIIAVLLGIFINKEKLLPHQRVGLVGALSVAIVLAFISS